jgi:hypothetical protein
VCVCVCDVAGFFKASFREFRRYYRTLLSPEPQATVGKIAPGGDVYNLDGECVCIGVCIGVCLCVCLYVCVSE